MGSNPEYHIERARAELDLAYRAEHRAAAEAHMHLSALHMKHAQVLEKAAADGAETGPRLRLPA